MILALLAALAIGVSLGLLGSGGSIFTIPSLVFILQRPEKEAIAESLAIVGIIAFFGSIPYMLREQVHWRSILFFGVPGMIGASIGGCGSYFIKGELQLFFLGFVMLGVAAVMLIDKSRFERMVISAKSPSPLVIGGFLIGSLTGVLGVGGGFILVPSLLLFCRLSMKRAVGTSLVIISLNAAIGFINQIFIFKILDLSVDWGVIATLSIAGVIGSLLGGLIGEKVSQEYLRRVFGVAVIVMGIYLLLRNLF